MGIFLLSKSLKQKLNLGLYGFEVVMQALRGFGVMATRHHQFT